MNSTPAYRLPAAARLLPLLLLLVWALPHNGHAFTHTVSGSAITFSDSASGGGGYVTFPHNAAMNTGTTFTAEAWVAAPTPCECIIFLRYKSSAEHKQLGVSSNGSVYFAYAGSPWKSPGGYITTVANIFPFDGQFHHVAFVRHSAGTYQVFIDGIEKMNAGPGPYWPLNSGIINSNPLTQIGDASVKASIDELRISSIDRYNANFTPAPRWESDASTVMLLHFGEGSGTTIHDSSSYGQTGTVTGGAIGWETGDSWSTMSTVGAPAARQRGTSECIWTGSKMIVWGGQTSSTTFGDGGMYDPVADTWSAMSTTGAPSARTNHSCVWTGSKMIVWGGRSVTYDGGQLNTGGIYDPATNTWSTMSTTNAPTARIHHKAVWTGSKMIVWGGYNGSPLNTGGIYDPATNTWTAMSTTNAPPANYAHSLVWTGSKMIMWGTGSGAYDPSTNTWSSISTTNAPEIRGWHGAVWTGTKMIVWGGNNVGPVRVYNSGGVYDPATDTWTATALTGAPVGRGNTDNVLVWTGEKMLVWGGGDTSGNSVSAGGAYDPETNTWSSITATGEPVPRVYHYLVWTGSKMVVWGGRTDVSGTVTNTGGIYTPDTPDFVLTGPVTNPANDHLYYLLDQDNWTNSEAHAVALGGHLVTINDAAENDWVFNTFNGYNGGDVHLWIGLYDPVSGDGSGTTHRNNFAWIDGTPMSYTNWETGEPNNDGGQEQYGMMYNWDSLFPGLWNDAPLDLSGWSDNQSIYGVVEVVPPTETQTITFPVLPTKTYGDADFAPGATASSGLAVAYTSSNAAVAAIVDGKIHIVGAGAATITASQSGNDTWNAAASVTKTLTVAKKTVVATAENKTRSCGAANPAFSITYTGLVRGDTVAVLDTPPTATCSVTATSGAGTYPITVSGGGDNNYVFSYVAGTLRITAVAPTVTTTAPVASGTTTATSGGTVTSAGGAAVTVRGVCWSTTTNPTVANAKTGDGTGTGAFTSTLTGLSAGTTYYVRAYAANSVGTGYGEPRPFTTPAFSGSDFTITDISITPELPAGGGRFTALVTVLNQGAKSGKAGTLYVWVDKPEAAAVGERGDKSASVSTLKPGQSKTVKLSLTAPKEWGAFTLRAFVDARNVTKEDNENNNQATYDYDTTLPDFEVLEVLISPEIPTPGQAFTAYVTVVNWGEVAGNAGYLDLWADSSALDELPVAGRTTKGNKFKSVGTLQPGQEKTITVTGLKAPVDNEWPVLGLLIDSRAKTPEQDEDYNWFEFEYECQ